MTDKLGTVYETINTLTGGVLPDGAVLRLKHILQTTSVPTFNKVFRGQELELTQLEIQQSLDPNFCFGSVSNIKNDINTVKFTLGFADSLYVWLQEDGTWNKCLQRPPGTSTFLSQSGKIPQDDPPEFIWMSGCFNCGQDHNLRDCPFVKDDKQIESN